MDWCFTKLSSALPLPLAFQLSHDRDHRMHSVCVCGLPGPFLPSRWWKLMAFWGPTSGRFVGPPPSVTSLMRHLLGGVTPMPAQGCVCRLWSTGWGNLVSYPLYSLHMRNSVNTCVGSYSGRCFTISSTFCINSFPRRKRRLMRYARVPTTESSSGLTINFAAISLFACFTNPNFFFHLLPLSSLILRNSCMPFYGFFFIFNCLFLCFLCYLFAYVKLSDKEFTYLLIFLHLDVWGLCFS